MKAAPSGAAFVPPVAAGRILSVLILFGILAAVEETKHDPYDTADDERVYDDIAYQQTDRPRSETVSAASFSSSTIITFHITATFPPTWSYKSIAHTFKDFNSIRKK